MCLEFTIAESSNIWKGKGNFLWLPAVWPYLMSTDKTISQEPLTPNHYAWSFYACTNSIERNSKAWVTWTTETAHERSSSRARILFWLQGCWGSRAFFNKKSNAFHHDDQLLQRDYPISILYVFMTTGHLFHCCKCIQAQTTVDVACIFNVFSCVIAALTISFLWRMQSTCKQENGIFRQVHLPKGHCLWQKYKGKENISNKSPLIVWGSKKEAWLVCGMYYMKEESSHMV